MLGGLSDEGVIKFMRAAENWVAPLFKESSVVQKGYRRSGAPLAHGTLTAEEVFGRPREILKLRRSPDSQMIFRSTKELPKPKGLELLERYFNVPEGWAAKA